MEMTLGDLLDRVAAVYPDNPCVACPDKPFRKTYAEFRDECNMIARGLLAIGVRPGSHVAIWASNYPEWIVLMYATAKIGATLVTVNTNYKIFEAEYLLRQSDTDTLVMMEGLKDTNYVQIVNELVPELKDSVPGELVSADLPRLKRVIYLDKPENTPKGAFHWSELRTLAEKVSEETRAAVQRTVSPHDVVNMQYTSGTTGFPKGVMLTNYNIVNNGKSIGDCMAFTEKDRLCIVVPFFHCFGMVLAVTACFTHGSTMVGVPTYSPLRVMQAITMERCTAFHGVPTM
ncbi:MAG: AMP-binding protein, partial [Clostridia bacterium]|nr:AMP-binding protein [Clostridia bacterium]